MADPSLLSEPVPSHHRLSIGSLEELIGEEMDNEQDEGKKDTTKEEIKQEPTAVEVSHPMIKQEEEVVPKDMGLSTTEAATITIVPEEDENIQDESLVRPLCVQQEPKHSNVMSINFLCGNGQQEQDTPNYERRRSSNCPLDLLVDAVMDAEYLRVQEEQQKKKKLQQQQQQSKNQHEITVVVNTDIHRDATQRVQSHNAVANWDYSPPTQLESPTYQHLDDGSNESKADSAVSLSPRFNESATFKKEEDDDMEDGYRWQQREMDDGLFNNDQDDQAFDEMLDDVSDLSSISSAEMCGWSDEDDDEEDEDDDGTENESTPSTPKNTTSARKSLLNQELICIACSRPLRRQDISDQVGADAAITNELATWTWSPSAVFMDWRPKRCPRCERHKIIYKQEWPNRKHKKANTGNKKKSKKMKKKKTKPVPASASSSSAPSNNTTATLPSSSATTPMTVTPVPMAAKSEIDYTEPIYQMQDDPQDLNYIPTSPLSTISDNDDDDDLY
jgi:hypothetical protein